MIRYLFKCKTLSPIHIGAGSDIEPLNYIIRGSRLHAIRMGGFICGLEDRKRSEFEGLIDAGNLTGIRKFLFENAEVENCSDFSTEVSPEVAGKYRSRLEDVQNQLLISPFIRDKCSGMPFLPGSSIKGAIRTALVSMAAKRKGLPNPAGPREEREFESKALGYRDPKNDPLRGMKIRDAMMSDGSTVVREVVNACIKKGGRLVSNSLAMTCEVTGSLLTGEPLRLDVEILFDDLLYATDFLGSRLGPRDIMAACNEFYRPKMLEEHKRFYKGSDAEPCSAELLNHTPDAKSFLVRLGRFSGVESVTLDNYRSPRPPGRSKVWGTSRNLAEGKYPMGWLLCELIESGDPQDLAGP